MIQNFIALPFDGINPLPKYVGNITQYTLVASVFGGYQITLAKLSVGSSKSAGTQLAHALFESFTDHGVPAKVVRTRVSGVDREFVAVRNAMSEAGVNFKDTSSYKSEAILNALGYWFKQHNNDIETFFCRVTNMSLI